MGVAALGLTRGRVFFFNDTATTEIYTVAEVVGATLVPRTGATAEGWSSNNETPGQHTYRVTRSVGGESSYAEATVVVPTRNLVGTQTAVGYLASAVTTTGNALGATLSTSFGLNPAVSPDRRTLAAQVRDDTGTALWLFDTEGRAIRALTQGSWDAEPAFSPDGKTVAFVHRAATADAPSIFTVATTAGAVPTPVAGTDNTSSPSWTPDGASLVLEAGDATTATEPGTDPLVVVRIATGARTSLPGTEGGRDPAVSRTGRVAFAHTHAAFESEVLVTDLGGATPVRWSPEPIDAWNWYAPAWDPQGVTLAFDTARALSSSGSRPVSVTGPGQQPAEWWVANPYYDFNNPVWFDAADAAPTASVTAPAVTRSSSTTAIVAVADSDDAIGGLAVSCRVDTGVWAPCVPGAWHVAAQKAGSHTLSVKVADPNGRTTTVSRTWVVDQAGPTVTPRSPAQPFTLTTSIPVSWTGSDAGSGVASYQVRWNRAAYNGGFGAWQYPTGWQKLTATGATLTGAVAGYDYCFQVRAVDKVGNTGSWSTSKCAAVALDDRSLSASTGWARVAWSAFYRSTATTTTKAGATLTRTGTALARIAVVATRCPSCGTVRVYVNAVSVGTVNLAASTTLRKSLIVLPRFSYRTGTVTIKVLSSGKLVQLDGLGISRT